MSLQALVSSYSSCSLKLLSIKLSKMISLAWEFHFWPQINKDKEETLRWTYLQPIQCGPDGSYGKTSEQADPHLSLYNFGFTSCFRELLHIIITVQNNQCQYILKGVRSCNTSFDKWGILDMGYGVPSVRLHTPQFLIIFLITTQPQGIQYRIAQNFGGEKLWRIDRYRVLARKTLANYNSYH